MEQFSKSEIRRMTAQFFVKLLCLGQKFFPCLYNFQDTYTIPMATPSAYMPLVGTTLV